MKSEKKNNVKIFRSTKMMPRLVSGFTLVEMVIYIAFFAMLSALAVQATIIVMNSFYRLRLTQNVDQSATVALERLSREIRNAYDVDAAQSTFETNPGRLMLNTKDAGGANTTTEFYMSTGNQLGIKEGGVDKGVLVTKNVTLTNLVFRSISTTNSKAIKIEVSFRDSRSSAVQTVKFYDTIVLRGSVH
ncbi:MAG: hypothetical protein HY228_02740 [Candidatus Yonathbacteria bacterium]|nr:hypothetical protein [Candidatus Yonathbacteria bacterium]